MSVDELLDDPTDTLEEDLETEELDTDTPSTSDPDEDLQSDLEGPVDDTVADALGLPPQSAFKTKQAYIAFMTKQMLKQKEELAARASGKAPDESKKGPADDTATSPETVMPEPQEVPPLPPLLTTEQIASATQKWDEDGDSAALATLLDDARNGQELTYQHFEAKTANMLAEMKRLGAQVSELQSGQQNLALPNVVRDAIDATEGATEADAKEAMQLMKEKHFSAEDAVVFASLKRRASAPAAPATGSSQRRASAQKAADVSTSTRRPPPPGVGGRASEDIKDIFARQEAEKRRS